MGKSWDATGIAFDPDLWREAVRVLKPGGWAKVFSATRTFHRVCVAMGQAGFEGVKDNLEAWTYGSGFPKSLNISKALDKIAGALEYAQAIRDHLVYWRDSRGFTNKTLNEALGMASSGGGRAVAWMSAVTNHPEIPSKEQWSALKAILLWDECLLDEVYALVKDGAKRPTLQIWETKRGSGSWEDTGTGSMFLAGKHVVKKTASATDLAKKWEGHGTALKPAWEPIVCGRKPA